MKLICCYSSHLVVYNGVIENHPVWQCSSIDFTAEHHFPGLSWRPVTTSVVSLVNSTSVSIDFSRYICLHWSSTSSGYAVDTLERKAVCMSDFASTVYPRHYTPQMANIILATIDTCWFCRSRRDRPFISTDSVFSGNRCWWWISDVHHYHLWSGELLQAQHISSQIKVGVLLSVPSHRLVYWPATKIWWRLVKVDGGKYELWRQH